MAIVQNISSFRQTHPKETKRFLKFAAVGTGGAIIDFGLFNLLLYLFRDVWTQQIFQGILGSNLELLLLTANTLAVSVAIISNFTWNRLWTFPESRSRKKRKQLIQFTLINIIGLVINNIILLAVHVLTDPFIVNDLLNDNLAKAVAVGLVLFWNFGANRLWTYRGL